MSLPLRDADQSGPRPSGLSLKRQLMVWLLLPQLVLWLVGGTLAYRIALTYATLGIDQSLTQSVRSLARQVKPIGSGLLIDFPRAAQAVIEEDPGDPVSYMVSSPPGRFVLGNVAKPLPGPASTDKAIPDNEPLLYNVRQEGRTLRVALLEISYGDLPVRQRMWVQVAKSLAVRERVARGLISDMLVPLLLLGALLSAMVYAGIVRGLRPLQKLQEQLGQTTVESLHPLKMADAPFEVHDLARAVNDLLAAVQRSVSQEKRFLSDAAHQLRTPLAGLKSQLDLALAETDPEALQARLRKVNAAVERSVHLVNQLLSLARSEGAIPLEDLDLAKLAREVGRDWASRLLPKGIDIGYEGVDQLQFRGNALLLREALGNLIDNAARYAKPGDPRGLSITLRLRRLPSQIELTVEDNGIGLSAAARMAVFERFARASELPGGVGLGLAIVREITERHGGQVHLLPHEPQGLLVQIQLPLTAA